MIVLWRSDNSFLPFGSTRQRSSLSFPCLMPVPLHNLCADIFYVHGGPVEKSPGPSLPDRVSSTHSHFLIDFDDFLSG